MRRKLYILLLICCLILTGCNFGYVYLEKQIFGINKLEKNKLYGFWKVKPEGSIENSSYILEFNEKNKLVEYRGDTKYTTEYREKKSENSSKDLINLITKEGETIVIKKIDDNNIVINRDGWDQPATRVSGDETSNIIKNTIKEDKYNKSTIKYNIQENIDKIIRKYEYDLIDAVNSGNFSFIENDLVNNSKLYNEQYENILKAHNNEISLTLFKFSIKKIVKINDREYRAVVYEEIEIRGKNFNKIEKFLTTYRITNEEEKFLISEVIEQKNIE